MVVRVIGRTLTSAWIETYYLSMDKASGNRRTLTSAWIETLDKIMDKMWGIVALSRVRGLKPAEYSWSYLTPRRTLTSAWIETHG